MAPGKATVPSVMRCNRAGRYHRSAGRTSHIARAGDSLGRGMTRRAFLLGSAGIAAGFLLGCGRRSPVVGNRRNLILIVSDTLRADHLGCYRSSLRLSPCIDALAERGTVFENVLSCAPLTAASHASLMTGCYQTRHGVAGNSGAIPKDLMTLAQVCRAAGYETAAVVSNPVLSRRNLSGIERGLDAYDATFPAVERNRDSLYRDAADTTAAALEWLRSGVRSPFFLWLHYQEPHGPYEVPDRSLLERVTEQPRCEGEPAALPVLRGNFGREGIPAYQVLGGERDPAHYRARYGARTAYVDQHIGPVLEEVRRLGMEDDTVVALTSDHGELLGEHGYYFQHGITVLQAVLQVPLILAGPGLSAGLRAVARVSNTSIMPTLLSLLDLDTEELADQMHGRSLVPVLQGAAESEEDYIYAMCEQTHEWSLLAGRHKFTLSESLAGNAGRLVDLEEDPGEEHDRSDRDPDAAARLEDALVRFMSAAPGLLHGDDRHRPRLTDEERRRFRALGYLD